MRSRGSSRFELPIFLKTIILIVLTIVVVVLCFLALNSVRGPKSETPKATSTSAGSATPNSTASGSSAGSSGTSTTSPGSATYSVTPASQDIVASGSTSAYRTRVGSCPDGGASIDVTSDGGSTWDSFDLSSQLGLGNIQSVGTGNGAYAWLIGQNLTDCTTTAAQTYTSGRDWELAPQILASEWYVDPTNTKSLTGPGGETVETPCELARLTTSTDSVAGVCTDGRIVISNDDGASWTESETQQGIDALAFTPDGLTAVLVGQTSCADGVALRTFDSALQSSSETCAPAGAAAGQTSLSAAEDGTLWLGVGDTVLRSSDAGASWE